MQHANTEQPLWALPLAGDCAACGTRLGTRAHLDVLPACRRIFHGTRSGYCELPNPPSPHPVLLRTPEAPEQS